MKPAFTLVMLLIISTSYCQILKIDPGFNCNGKAAIRTGAGISSAMAVQPDGKIIVGGRGGENINNSGYCLVRFNANGTVDATFGNKGMTITIYGGSIQSIVVLPDGRILAGGFLGNIMLAMYKPDGNLDSTFGNNGLLQPNFDGIRYSFCYAMKLQTDGKIILTGNVNGYNALIARLLPDGSFDTAFAKKGYTILAAAYIGFDVVIQADNKIVMAGQGLNSNNFLLARYLPDGNADTQFGTNGIAQTDMTDMSEFLSSIALQLDGKIVAAGRYNYNSQYTNNFKMAVLRYNIDGSPDNSFGEKGITKFGFDDASADPKKVMLQSDGKIVVAGDYTNIYSFHKPYLTRFNADGEMDSSFANGGTLVTLDFGDSLSCKSAALFADGKIIIAGYQMVQLDTSVLYYTDSFVVIQYKTNSILPVAFLHFSAEKQDKYVVLNWQTGNGINNNYFSLQRSSSNTFSELGKIQPNDKHAYSYLDNLPLPGTNYYRLKQVDKDGYYNYSQVLSVVFDGRDKFIVYPNPVSSALHIQGLNNANAYHLSLTGANGEILAQINIMNQTNYSWNAQNLNKGFYYLTISSNNKTSVVKIIKQ